MKNNRPTSPSIPSKGYIHNFRLSSQNVNKLKQYQYEHVLESIDQPILRDKFSEQVPPLPQQFQQKKKKQIITLPEFLKKEYPPPFNGAQAVKEDNNLNQLGSQDLKIIKLSNNNKNNNNNNNELQKENEIIYHQIPEEESLETINEIHMQLSQQHDQYITDFCNRLEQEKVQKKINQFVNKPLNELLMIKEQFDTKQKDNYRVLSAQEKKLVQEKHEVVQQELKQKQKKLSLDEMEQELEKNKKDYFKIIRELDLLNKGARDLKQATNQKYPLRKKVEPPKIDKLIQEVKNTIWYHGGVTDNYPREMELIRHVNSQNQNNLIGINDLIDQEDIGVVDDNNDKRNIQEQQQDQQQEEIQKKDKYSDQESQINSIQENQYENEIMMNQSKQSISSQQTKLSAQPSVQISKKGKQMNELMSEDIF